MELTQLTFAGHSATFIQYGTKTVAIDPWLEGNPLCPEELKNPQQLDLIVLTHGHSDHASDTVRLAKHYGCKVAATFELATLIAKDGIPPENIIFMNKGGTITWEGLQVTLTHAFHSNSYDTSDGPAYAGEACGVILRDKKHSIYHAGDTAMFRDMKFIGRFYKPTLALLPIGDVFTMGPEEAVEAAKRIGVKRVIPIHHSTFPLLTGTPEQFTTACKDSDIDVITLQPGASISL